MSALEINGFPIDEYNIYKFPQDTKKHTCPLCSEQRKKKNDKCLTIFWDTGLAYCNHCGETLQLHTYKRKNQEKEYSLPPKQEFQYQYSENLIKWFKDIRGISKATLEHFKVTEGKEYMPQVNKEANVIKFNYFIDKNLINIKFRDGAKNFKLYKGAEKIMYNLNAIRHSSECVIVEGEIDVLSCYESGYNHSTSVPNGFNLKGELNLDYITNCYEFFENKERIILAVDNDDAGKKGEKELARRFGAEKIWLVDFEDCKDANEYMLKHGKIKLLEKLQNPKPYPLENVTTIDDNWDQLTGFWKNGAPKGMTIGLENQDNAISFDWKQYTLMLSAPGSGKSEKLDDIVARLIHRYNVKVAYCSVENEPHYIHYNKIFRKIYGRTPNPNEIDSEYVSKTKEFIKDNICHVSFEKRYELKAVLQKFEELVKRKGVRVFVLDPFNKIKNDGVAQSDVNLYTNEYHMLIDEFVKKTQSHLFLVLHPTKLQTKEGSTKTYIMPTAYHAKGGGEHFDMSYNIIGMVRDYERQLIHFRTLKVKFQHLGTAGVDWFEAWNINNGRFNNVEDYDADSTHTPEVKWDNDNWLLPKPDMESQVLPFIDPKDAFEEDDINDVPF
tara:strand:+ start:11278 stop:13110 length:1833 start_codon:yes stop_codon:yes gene_type:complete